MSSRRTKLPAGWESGISDDYEYVPLRLPPGDPCHRLDRLAIQAELAAGNCPASGSHLAAAGCPRRRKSATQRSTPQPVI